MRMHLFCLMIVASLSSACVVEEADGSGDDDSGGNGTGGSNGSGGGGGNDEGGGGGSNGESGSSGGGGSSGEGGPYSKLSSATATRVVAGRLHSCALTSNGSVRCWGYQEVGQLGNGVSGVTERSPAVEVQGLGNVTALAAYSDHTCAVSDGGAYCWGSNDFGELGNGTREDSGVPVAVEGLGDGVVAVATGGTHSCALTDAGSVKCWGEAARLGDGTNEASNVPVDVEGLDDVVAIAAGEYHACALTGAGNVKCWGASYTGELGVPDLGFSLEPVDVEGLPGDITDLSAGFGFTCAITGSGATYCWGANDDGQCGDGTGGGIQQQSPPVEVSGLASSTGAIAAGVGFACAVVDGGARCWGTLKLGQEELEPVAVGGLDDITAVAAGHGHACALTGAGAVKCWGDDEGGQLGHSWDSNAGIHYSDTPVAVSSLP